jgi:hypothetical protein
MASLAYPYGKRDDMTASLREQLSSLGISCCLSAYGGTNSPDFDPWDIHNFSPLALRALIEGWMPRVSGHDWTPGDRARSGHRTVPSADAAPMMCEASAD